MSEVIRLNHGDHGSYSAHVAGSERKAFLTWRARGDVRVADHTFVPPEARGQGLAAELLDALIADARREHFKIEPQCSYVVAAFRRHPEWADVLAGASS